MNFFGLDIGNSSLKLVEVKIDRSKGKVLSLYGSSSLSHPVNLAVDGPEDLKELSSVIREFVDSYSLSSNKVVVALPESQIFTRVVSLPKMPEKELAKAMQYEAQQYIPVSLSEVSLDYQMISDSPTSAEQMEILVIAAPKTLVSKYLKVLKDSSLEVAALETETMAVARSLIADAKTPCSLVVNIGALTTDLSVVSGATIRFTRSISTGGTSLARAISQSLGFDLNQAEEYKRTYGLDSSQLEGKITQAIKPIFDVVIDEIKRSTAFYNTHHKEDKVKRVVVCGGTASLPGILIYMASSLDLEVILGNSWSRIYIPAKFSQKELEESGPSYAVAAGLALKEI
ncbi:MAG: pilus assembly protein PilM [Patescibacteria group bacterium]|nr:pilus assembly protein PilM [Patescibacteria group bacterium]